MRLAVGQAIEPLPKNSHSTLITGKAKPQLTTLASRLAWPMIVPRSFTVAFA